MLTKLAQIEKRYLEIEEALSSPEVMNDLEGYKKYMGDLFGKNIFAMFTDEPVLYYPFYLEDVTEFENRYGYTFCEMVPALFENVLGEKGKQFNGR